MTLQKIVTSSSIVGRVLLYENNMIETRITVSDHGLEEGGGGRGRMRADGLDGG